MHVRPFQISDLQALAQMADSSGFPYPDPTSPRLEALLVVVDDEGKPIMACAAERIAQLYLWCGSGSTPHGKLFCLRLLHEEMACVLKEKGYDGVEAFLPPSVSGKFGKRLERTFGWIRNWSSWTKGF